MSPRGSGRRILFATGGASRSADAVVAPASSSRSGRRSPRRSDEDEEAKSPRPAGWRSARSPRPDDAADETATASLTRDERLALLYAEKSQLVRASGAEPASPRTIPPVTRAVSGPPDISSFGRSASSNSPSRPPIPWVSVRAPREGGLSDSPISPKSASFSPRGDEAAASAPAATPPAATRAAVAAEGKPVARAVGSLSPRRVSATEEEADDERGKARMGTFMRSHIEEETSFMETPTELTALMGDIFAGSVIEQQKPDDASDHQHSEFMAAVSAENDAASKKRREAMAARLAAVLAHHERAFEEDLERARVQILEELRLEYATKRNAAIVTMRAEMAEVQERFLREDVATLRAKQAEQLEEWKVEQLALAEQEDLERREAQGAAPGKKRSTVIL